MEYQIVIDCETGILCATVADLMAEGWMPQGGIAVVVETWENLRKGGEESQVSYCQAMVKGSYQAIQAHDLQPGSVVVMSVPETYRISGGEAMAITEALKEKLPEGVEVVVLHRGLKITDVLKG